MKENVNCHDDFPTVSVIVPVYNNTVQLLKCLKALDLQSYPSHLYEIIVVDNGSTEAVQELLSVFSNEKDLLYISSASIFVAFLIQK